MHIIGVDFSGAGADTDVGKTWIARGELNRNILTLNSCRPISRDCLTHNLAALTNDPARLHEPAVVAMDFPFSVPERFARHCNIRMRGVFPDGGEMPGLWAAVADIELDQFTQLRNYFYADHHREPRRAGDPPEALSPLNIRMLPMTFRGMRMLHHLWGWPEEEIQVPPLHPDPEWNTVTLLEVMPGATLRSFRLPHIRYKNTSGLTPEQREQRRGMREYILNELPDRAGPVEVDLRVDTDRPCHRGRCQVIRNNANRTNLYDICRYHDDALDAVVAAITAALWHEARGIFRHPVGQELQVAQLEGWLYAPQNAG